jgi:hypothetical protein
VAKDARGETHRPDVVSRAVKVLKIAAGEIEDDTDELTGAATERGKKRRQRSSGET